jgi:SNF2 family DNA or RNA helicase
VQALAFLLREKNREKTEPHAPALVVTPTSVLPNWIREAQRFAPALRVVDFSGGGRKLPADDSCDLIVTSYAILRRDAELLQGRTFSTAILDEAQNIKNPQSVTAKSAYGLKADFRIALTGTPVENRPLDLWSIFHYLSPELLSTQAEFSQRYESPTGVDAEKAHHRLAARIRPFLRRRLKRDVLTELPDKQESEMVCELTGNQKKLYLQVLKEVRRDLLGTIETQGVVRSQLNILAGLLRLRQVACDPRLLKREEPFNDEDSGKLLLWQELLEEALEGDHRVVCFSQFVEMLKLMRAALDKAGIRYEYLDGKTRDRQEVIDRFNQKEGAAPVFLISLKAGGTGLNLATADTVFIYDPWWNPAVEDQAIDRVHRIGQGREVTVYRLLARGTVEEKILELKARKRSVSARLIAGDSAAPPTFTAAEVEELLRVG